MKISPNYYFITNNTKQSIEKTNNSPKYKPQTASTLMAYPSNYYFSFEARVDKGLKRFYEQNKDYMPETVKSYIDSLPATEKETKTPLDVQREAFEYLEICDTPEDVIDAYPNETLFSNLKSVKDTRANRGLLYDIRLMQEDIEANNESIVNTNEDLTIYLLKKIFLESKTIGEINEDLHNDLNPVFQKEDKNYISSSTLNSLGIQLPRNEYLTSLRYTRDGYSDKIGETISNRWNSLSDEEKLERINALLGGKKELTPEKRAQISEKRSEIMKTRWQNMTPDEKVALIEKMNTGSEEGRIVMINAWNHCTEIRLSLSDFLTENNYYNSFNLIYKDGNFSDHMRKIMSEFWQRNPEYANQLGEAITNSYSEIERAKSQGSYEDFCNEILVRQKEIKTEMKNRKNTQTQPKQNERESFEKFKTEYRKLFYFLPKEYLELYFDNISVLYGPKITKGYHLQKRNRKF